MPPDRVLISMVAFSYTQARTAIDAASRSRATDRTPECATNKRLVARYVADLTANIVATLEQHGNAENTQGGRCCPLDEPREPTRAVRDKCVLITGATGGLGAHLVEEAARRDDVSRVICLNRSRKGEDARARQAASMRTRGIDDVPALMTKVEVLEVADMARPRVGLSDHTYGELMESVTDVVHNAWLMHSKWPLKRFEPQLRIMANLLQLAVDISAHRGDAHGCGGRVTFVFVSSIATVGHHPLLTGQPVVPEEPVSIESVLPTGYGLAKYACERMLDATLRRYARRFRAASVRLGQIAGSSRNGHWNAAEHVSFLVKSSQTLGALPELPGTAGWTPADAVAGTLMDILLHPAPALEPVYHVENPVRQPWGELLDVLAAALARRSQGPVRLLQRIPLDEWLRRVRDWPHRQQGTPDGANPAYLLVDFLHHHFLRMSCGGLLLSTVKARAHSPTLAGVGPVDSTTVNMYVQGWKTTGFLES